MQRISSEFIKCLSFVRNFLTYVCAVALFKQKRTNWHWPLFHFTYNVNAIENCCYFLMDKQHEFTFLFQCELIWSHDPVLFMFQLVYDHVFIQSQGNSSYIISSLTVNWQMTKIFFVWYMSLPFLFWLQCDHVTRFLWSAGE